jgi:hypothetical protein
MKIAFIILAHRHPAQLKRLLQALSHPGIDCYVHVDAKCNLSDWEDALSLPNVYIAKGESDLGRLEHSPGYAERHAGSGG